MNFNHP